MKEEVYEIAGVCACLRRWLTAALLLVLCFPPATCAEPVSSLADLSLEELMTREVSSVSRRKQPLARAAAAVWVITAEEIQRSGLTSIPEILRLAPGLQVAQIDGTKWAVSARGFHGRFSNKLLVLLDGRTVYSPMFAGVYWEMLDLALGDVERIEVIRGPGATMWGSNAVNGVINIITKKPKMAPGGAVQAYGGNLGGGMEARFAGQASENTHYRAWAKTRFDEGMPSLQLGPVPDEMRMARGGFRLDWSPSPDRNLVVEGGGGRGRILQTNIARELFPPFQSSLSARLNPDTAWVSSRYERKWGSRFTQEYLFFQDRMNRPEPEIGVSVQTTDAEVRNTVQLNPSHTLAFGSGLRVSRDSTSGSPQIRFTPAARWMHLASLYVQDEFRAMQDRLELTAGLRFEDSTLAGSQWQPSLRALWQASRRQSVWAAGSRAVRNPARYEHDGLFQAGVIPPDRAMSPLPVQILVAGNSAFLPETLLNGELGYRFDWTRRLSVDISAFWNRYENLMDIRLDSAPVAVFTPVPHLLQMGQFTNAVQARGRGVETAAKFVAAPGWKINASHSWLDMEFRNQFNPLATVPYHAGTATRQWKFQSYLDLPQRFNWDVFVYRWNGAEAGLTVGGMRPALPGHTRIDTRIGWKIRGAMEFSATLQNLLDPKHPEAMAEMFTDLREVRRGLVLRVSWGF